MAWRICGWHRAGDRDPEVRFGKIRSEMRAVALAAASISRFEPHSLTHPGQLPRHRAAVPGLAC